MGSQAKNNLLNLQVGDQVPFRSVRGLVGGPIDPVWHALITAPMGESKAVASLERAGVEACFPTWKRVRHSRGKKIETDVPCVPRVIYARFKYAPQWDVLRRRRVIMGVFSRNGAPVQLSADDVAKVMGLPTEADRLEAERRERTAPVPGKPAKFMSGPFKDFFVEVTKVEEGRIWYQMIVGNIPVVGEDASGLIQRVAE